MNWPTELRTSSNAASASIAEGFSNKNIRLYVERINKAMGEFRAAKHCLNIAFQKRYIEKTKHTELIHQYGEYGRMLKSLEKSVNTWNSTKHAHKIPFP